MAARKAGGRPKSYDPTLIAEAIVKAEAMRGAVTVETVRELLFADFGLSRSVRPESLDAEIRIQIAEHERRRDDACIARLPEAVRAEIDDAASAMARLMALTCGRHVDRSEAALASRLDEEGRQRLELIRRIAAIEGERDRALEEVQARDEALETARTAVGAKERQIARLEKRIARLEGVIEGRQSIASPSSGITDRHEDVPV